MNSRSLFWGMILAFFGAIIVIKSWDSETSWHLPASVLVFSCGVQTLAFQISRWTSGIGILIGAVGLKYLGRNYSIKELQEELKSARREDV